MCMRHLCTVSAVHVCDVRVKGRLQTVLVCYLRMNQVECISDTLWQRAAGHTAGGGTSLQVTSGLQEAAIVLLHTSWTTHVVNNCSNTRFNICQRSKSMDTFKKHKAHPPFYYIQPIPNIIMFDRDHTLYTLTWFCLKKSQYLQLQELLNHTLSRCYVIRTASEVKTSAQSPDRNQTDQCSIQAKVPSHFPARRHKSPLRPTALHEHTEVSPNCVQTKRCFT